jgi:S-adenosylmethionine-dependent methyltransferase
MGYQPGNRGIGATMMPPSDDDPFSHVLDRWQHENTLPWGRLRYHSTWRNIARHIPNGPLRILDIGGGDGMDAIHYARLGHRVTLTDLSPAMLAAARNSAAELGLAERLTSHQAGVEALAALFQPGSFDMVLCHMMIEFVPDAPALLRDACALLAPNGLLSVLDTNRYSDVYMQALQKDSLPGALEALDRRQYHHPWVERLTPRFSAAEIIELLAACGCPTAGQYGVLNLCAYLPNEPKFDPAYFDALVALEDRLADTYPYSLLARFFHVIGRKP